MSAGMMAGAGMVMKGGWGGGGGGGGGVTMTSTASSIAGRCQPTAHSPSQHWWTQSGLLYHWCTGVNFLLQLCTNGLQTRCFTATLHADAMFALERLKCSNKRPSGPASCSPSLRRVQYRGTQQSIGSYYEGKTEAGSTCDPHDNNNLNPARPLQSG